jgi:hypothetical protein
MRNKIKLAKKGKCGIYQALGIKNTKIFELESMLLKLCTDNPQLSDVCVELWNDKKLNDVEVIVSLIGIGRALQKKEFQDMSANILGNVLKKINGSRDDK